MSKEKPERHINVTDRDRVVAKLILLGDSTGRKSIREAFLMAGYSEGHANKGRAAITHGVRAAMLELQGEHHIAMGQQLRKHPELLHDAIVGWLYQSMLDKNSKGVTAAKLLGSHKSIDMFVKEGSQNQVLVINAPAEFTGLDTKAMRKEQPPKALPPSEAPEVDYE